MKTSRLIIFSIVACLISIANAWGLGPMTYQEISVSLRTGVKLAEILRDVQQRKLLHGFTEREQAGLRALGAPDAFLVELGKPEYLAPKEMVAAVEAHAAEAKRPQAGSDSFPPEVRRAESVVPQIPPGHTLVIDKIVIDRQPLAAPFYVAFSVTTNDERLNAEFHPTGQSFGAPADTRPIEIPVNLTLAGVNESEWVTVRLHLDGDERVVGTVDAKKRHSGRIPATEKPGRFGSGFSDPPPCATFVPGLNPGEEWVYRVFWHMQ